MKKHEINLDKGKKRLSVKVWGMYEEKDAKSFIEEFQKQQLLYNLQSIHYLLIAKN